MFRPMRRAKREITEQEAKQLLRESRRGVLAVSGDNGYPYAVPINYLYDEAQNRIIFHSACEGQKVEALDRCDKVCFTVYGNEHILKEAWAPYVQSTIVFGRCKRVEDSTEARALLKRFAMKYFPEESIADREIESSAERARVYIIDIEHLTGKQIQEK